MSEGSWGNKKKKEKEKSHWKGGLSLEFEVWGWVGIGKIERKKRIIKSTSNFST